MPSSYSSMADCGRSPAGHRVTRAIPIVLACLGLVAMVGGCGKKDPFARQPVRGTIKWQGKPIRHGSITLEPLAGQKTGASASIADGAFSIGRQAGPSPGLYAVWVHAFDRGADPPPGTAPGEEGPPPQEILPEKYRNAAAGQFDVKDVKDDAPNLLELDLQ